MRIACAGLLSGMLVVAITQNSCAQQTTLAAGTALRVELDKRVRIHPGAVVSGHLTEPVYLVDHEVIPIGTTVSGTIRGTHAGKRKDHVRRLLAGDFTPVRLPDVVFDTLTIPSHGGLAESKLMIDAPAQQTNASVLTLGTAPKRRSLRQQVGDRVEQAKQETRDALKEHHYWEIIEKWAVGQLPYHPEILWRKARFNADLTAPIVIPDTAHSSLPIEPLHNSLPAGTIRARLISSLDSGITRRGDDVEAVVTKPLLTPDGTHLLVPEGAHLFGKVSQVKPASRFGRNGSLRFSFSRISIPGATATAESFEVHGKLSGAETARGERISMDDEGNAKANDSMTKYAEPALLAILAAGAAPDDSHPGTAAPGAAGYSSNGFGLVARVVSLATRDTNVIQGFAYYSLGKSIYFNFVDKGKDTTFPHDTEVEVTFSER